MLVLIFVLVLLLIISLVVYYVHVLSKLGLDEYKSKKEFLQELILFGVLIQKFKKLEDK